MLQGLLTILLVGMTVLTWILTLTDVQHSSKSITSGFGHELLLHTEAMVNDELQQNNASAISLSNFLGSLNGSNVTNAFLGDQVSIPSYFRIV